MIFVLILWLGFLELLSANKFFLIVLGIDFPGFILFFIGALLFALLNAINVDIFNILLLSELIQ